jgi:hypothetical protein
MLSIFFLNLGTGESGKSTFIKQMRIIHGDGYSEEEKQSFIRLIHLNVITAINAIVLAMENLGVDYEIEENKENATIINSNRTSESTGPEYWTAVKSLWKDPGVQQCFERRNEYQLIDSCK